MNRNESNPNDANGSSGHGDDSMMGMMAMMMAMCFSVILLLVILPNLGFPLGLFVAVGAGAVMLVLHGRFMRHTS